MVSKFFLMKKNVAISAIWPGSEIALGLQLKICWFKIINMKRKVSE